MTEQAVSQQAEEKLAAIEAHTRRALTTVAVVSAVLNVLLLGGSIYMMLVYDLVLPSHSVPTLVGLAILILVVYLFQGVLDFIRGRLLIHFGAAVDVDLNRDIHELVCLLARSQNEMDSMQPVRDLDSLRSFLTGPGPTALVDLPWMLFFIVILFLLHPALGVAVLIGGAILVFLTYLTERLTIAKSGQTMKLNSMRLRIAETTRRHADVLRANGMEGRMADRWTTVSGQFLAAQERLSGVSSGMSNLTKILRMVLQSGVLTVGALLVLEQQATGGVIFASSILSSRALAPVEAAIAQWRGFVSARQSWQRLKALISAMPPDISSDVLQPPKQALNVENVTLGPPGTPRHTVRDVSFAMRAGEAVAIIGPSGCGKSTLARALVGIWPLGAGHVRLDGADLKQWPPEVIGRHIGYVPQNVELIDGTIAENISRFEPGARPDAIIAAAKMAGVHELILRLPEGYNSQVGSDGRSLSGGQRQRIALARALYGDPFLLVLDEPNSNLDAEGEEALAAAIAQVRARGAITVIIAHRPSILSSVDLVLLMVDGVAKAFGPAQKIVPSLMAPAQGRKSASNGNPGPPASAASV